MKIGCHSVTCLVPMCSRDHRLNSKWRRYGTTSTSTESKRCWLLQSSRWSGLYNVRVCAGTHNSTSQEQGLFHILILMCNDLKLENEQLLTYLYQWRMFLITQHNVHVHIVKGYHKCHIILCFTDHWFRAHICCVNLK